MPRVYVSIGSNIDRAANIRAGVRALEARFGALALSSVYDSRAVGFEGDDFYNLVAGFDTEADVSEVAAFLREAEAARGRVRPGRGAGFVSRTLDMDLILYGDTIMDEPRLRLPRPEVLEYAFVLAPLAEIAAGERHPVLGETYAALWTGFSGDRASMSAIDFEWSRD